MVEFAKMTTIPFGHLQNGGHLHANSDLVFTDSDYLGEGFKRFSPWVNPSKLFVEYRMEPLRNARSTDGKSQSIVFGYVREMESSFAISEVASLIINIILGFYYHEEYITEYVKEFFQISQDRLTITNIKDIYTNFHSIYLNQWIESTSKAIIKWTFKINKLSQSNQYYFGITSNEKAPDTDFAVGVNSYYIGYNGRVYRGSISCNFIEPFRKTIRDGDSVTFTLHLPSKSWLGRIDRDEKPGTDYKFCKIDVAEDIRYKFVIQLGAFGDSVTLTSFKREYL